jgi:signal transduction histidine kinase
MKPGSLVARLQDLLPGRSRQGNLRQFGFAGLLVFALALELLAVVLTVAGIPPRLRELGGTLSPQAWLASYTLFFEIVMAAVFFAAAGLILYVRRLDGLALLLSLALVALGATETGMTDALINPQWNPGGVGWRSTVYALRSLAMAAALLLLYTFPDGRFTPRWTRPLAAVWIGLNIAWFFFPRIPFNPNDGPTWRATPLLSMAFGVAWFSTGIIAQVLRYRRATDPLTRLQTKWTAAGMLAAVLGTTLYYGLLVDYNTFDLLRLGDLYFAIRPPLRTILVSLFPVFLGVAVLRFRLWDINLILNRALVYSTLTLLVAGVYILVVGGLGGLLEARGSLWLALLATALVAVLFQPLRERIQSAVDRLVYGERRDPYRVISALGQRLEAAIEPEAVLPAIVETVVQALKLPYVAIRLHQVDESTPPIASGSPPESGATLAVLPLIYQGDEVWQLLAAPRPGEASLSPADLRLLGDLARQAGIAVHAAQATLALRQARERLVSAREEERRRLRRDLHDGLGPRLASQTLTLDVIARLVHTHPHQAEALARVLGEQTQQAVAEIRELINGLRPPTLDELGLSSAIAELASRLAQADPSLQISLERCSALPELPAAIEVAAYRIAQEALTNVVKHAQASQCQVIMCVETFPAGQNMTDEAPPLQVLVLEISDNGRGLPAAISPGVGLASMSERAAEVGGRLLVESNPGGGALLRAELPIPQAENISP